MGTLTNSDLADLLRYLTPQEKEEIDRLLKSSVLTFREFVDKVKPNYVWYRHNAVLADRLQDVADGKIKRLMVFMPPRHGKSEEVSRLFPAYCVYRDPARWVSVTSYEAGLAQGFGNAARDNFLLVDGKIRRDVNAKDYWQTPQGGGLWTAGIGGAATGKGYGIGIIDDPVKNMEEARSDAIKRRNIDWIDSVWQTRQEPDAALVVTVTRWAEDDPAGYLLSKCELEDGEGWHIINFEAIKEEEPKKFPVNCTIEPDWREPGEALCPERYSISKLNALKRNLTAFVFNALYQQRPRPRTDAMFQRHWFGEPKKAAPTGITAIRYWDKAGTQGGTGAETAGVLMGRTHEGRYIILDVIHGRWSAHNRNKTIKQTAAIDAPKYDYWIFHEQEPGSGGKESAEQTTAELSAYAVYADRVTGDKVTRAEPFSAQCEAGNVDILEGSWNEEFLRQLEDFPNGTLKDMVDAASGAYNKLQEIL